MGIQNSKEESSVNNFLNSKEYKGLAEEDEDEPLMDFSPGNYRKNLFIGQNDEKIKDNSIYFKSPPPVALRNSLPSSNSSSLRSSVSSRNSTNSVFSRSSRDSFSLWKSVTLRNFEKSTSKQPTNKELQRAASKDSLRNGPSRRKTVQIIQKRPSNYFTKEDLEAAFERAKQVEKQRARYSSISDRSNIVFTEIDEDIRPGDYVLVTVRPKPGMPKYPVVVRPLFTPNKEEIESLKEYSWYFGDVTREEANYLLRKTKPGTYMVRNSTSNPSGFALSIKTDGDEGIKHYMIEKIFNRYSLRGMNSYRTVDELIEATRNNETGLPDDCLLYPCSKDEKPLCDIYNDLNDIWRENFIEVYSHL